MAERFTVPPFFAKILNVHVTICKSFLKNPKVFQKNADRNNTRLKKIHLSERTIGYVKEDYNPKQ